MAAGAYDQDLAERIRGLLATEGGVEEKKMFGGLAFLVGGHLAIAASRGPSMPALCRLKGAPLVDQ